MNNVFIRLDYKEEIKNLSVHSVVHYFIGINLSSLLFTLFSETNLKLQ